MSSNRLQVNPSTTEVLWCSSSRRQHQIPTLPVRIGSTYVLPVTSVRDLGLYIDCDVSLQTHVAATVRSCFAALRQIRSVRRCLPRHALLSLIRVLVVSKVDYCCSVLAGVSRQFGAHHSASPRASLAAGSETANIPSVRSDTLLPQRISAGIPRREHWSDSRRGKPLSSTVVHNNNACRSAGAEIYPIGV